MSAAALCVIADPGNSKQFALQRARPLTATLNADIHLFSFVHLDGIEQNQHTEMDCTASL